MALGILSLVLTDLSFAPLPGQDGPILSDIDGDIVLTTIDQFPAHKMTLSAADARTVRAIDPSILPCGCIVTEEGMGEVARGYIEDPQAQITEAGHVITLNIPPATEALRWDTLGPGWVAATGIDTIANRIASHSPPWQAHVVDTGSPVVSVSPLHWIGNDPTTSNADLNTITKDDGVVAGWNVGATTQEFAASGDCAITTVAFGCATYRMFGFTHAFTTYSYEMLDHAIYLATDGKNLPTSGSLAVFESGSQVYAAAPGSYYPGDVLSVAVVNGRVQYLINNTVFYTSGVPPSYPCHGACSIYSANAAVLGGTWTSYVAPKDTYYAVSSENGTVLDALMKLSSATFRHIRQKQVNGVPVQQMELGLFSAPPAMVLKTSDGESPSQLRARNGYTRLIAPQVDYSFASSQIISAGAAFGGGTGDTQVKLQNLYDYLHPPAQTVIDPITGALVQRPVPVPTPRNGQATIPNAPTYYPLFPEYDDANFPIERRVGLNGTYYYVILNKALVAALKAKGHHSGEIWGGIDDSTIVYVDKSPDAQKQAVERTLYVSCVTKLKRHAQLEFTATIQTDGRGRITQAGDLVNVRIARTGRSAAATGSVSFQSAAIDVNPMVTSVIRQYREGSITDKWQVSSLGRLLTDDSQALGDQLRQLEAVRLIPSTASQTVLIGPSEQTINSLFPFDLPVELPNTMSRMTSASLHVKIKPARHNISLVKGAILDGQHDHTLTIPPLTVSITPLPAHTHTGYTPRHDHGGISGNLSTTGSTAIGHGQGTSVPATRTGGGVTTGNAPSIDGHYHQIFAQGTGYNGTDRTLWVMPTQDGPSGEHRLGVAGTPNQAFLHTNTDQRFDSSHGHGDTIAVGGGGAVKDYTGQDGLGATRGLGGGATPINFATTIYPLTGTATLNDNGGNLIGMTTGQVLGTRTDDPLHAGQHTHNLLPDVAETNLGGYVQVWINSGDGVFIDRSPELGGPWNGRDVEIKGNVFVDSNGAQVSGTGMERFLQAPGKIVGVRIVAVNAAGNPTGICNVQVHGTWEFDKYAINSTIFAGAGNG